MNKKRSAGINIGTSSILVIFVLLALFSFAALSYMSAKSDYTLSVEAAKRTASFYDANRMAEISLADVEAKLAKLYDNASSEDEYYSGIEELFKDNNRIYIIEENSNVTINYKVMITDGQNLEVQLVAHYPTADDSRLVIINKWATAVNENWLEEVNKDDNTSGVKLLFE